MKKSSLFMIILSIILVLSSVPTFAAVKAASILKINITMGTNDKRPVSNYTQNSSSQVTWSSRNSSIASVSGNDIVSYKSTGTTIIDGKSADYKYEIVVKVIDSPVVDVVSNEKKDTSVKKSDGSTVKYKDLDISIGVNDKVNINGILPETYDQYLWRINMPKSFSAKTFSYSKGILCGKKQGIVKLRVAGNSTKTKNNVYRINVTVDSNYIAKSFKVNKNKSYNLNQFVGDAENFVFSVKQGNGASVTIKDGIMSTSSSTGTSIVTAESTTGGKNYTLVVKII